MGVEHEQDAALRPYLPRAAPVKMCEPGAPDRRACAPIDLGHEKKTLGYGLYSSGSSMKQKLEAVSKVAYPGALGAP
jgi:hypothetical protein